MRKEKKRYFTTLNFLICTFVKLDFVLFELPMNEWYFGILKSMLCKIIWYALVLVKKCYPRA